MAPLGHHKAVTRRFFAKKVFQKFSEFKGKHLSQGLLSNITAECFKKRLLHRSFSVTL